MWPFEDRVLFYYARNATSEAEDDNFLMQLANLVEAISTQGNISYGLHFRPDVP